MSIVSDNKFDENIFQQEIESLKGDEYEALSTMRYGNSNLDGSAIIGKDDYIFIYRGSNAWDQQITADVVISDSDIKVSCDVIGHAQIECRKRGISFCTVVVPEKDVIYPEFSPNCKDKPLVKRSIHKLLDQNKHIIYPQEDLLNYKHICQLYHKFDSHFNVFGGFVIFNTILNKVGIEQLAWEEINFVHSEWQDDLSVKWLNRKLIRRNILPQYREKSVVVGNPLTGTHIHFTSQIVENDDIAIIYGDSYSWNIDAGLSRFLLYRFKEVHFIWSRSINWALVDEIQPKLIIVQSAERFLISGLVRL